MSTLTRGDFFSMVFVILSAIYVAPHFGKRFGCIMGAGCLLAAVIIGALSK